ncbi:GroES-like protein [Cubamyces sp. BRFM 1775]|nr:GroES-like protein [Cubamyces sp. BRFM 1775]
MVTSALPHPTSFAAFAFNERGGDLQKISTPWKDPQVGTIVIKVLACGICATDLTIANGAFPVPLPRVPGHEIVGDVVAVGPQEKLWKVGDRVGVGCHGGYCSRCKRCRVGDFITCEEQDLVGMLSDGGYAEYVTVRSEAVAAVPRDLDPAETAPLFCAGVTVFNGLRTVNLPAGATVAVQGIGGLGHLAIQFAHAMGYRTVALSSGPDKEDLARRLGAVEYVDGSKTDQAEALRNMGGAKLIMCTATAPEATKKLIKGLDVDGTLLLLAVDNQEFGVSPLALVRQRYSIRGLPNGTAQDIEDCIAFAKLHNIKAMVERFPLEMTPEAFQRREHARFRAVIVP